MEPETSVPTPSPEMGSLGRRVESTPSFSGAEQTPVRSVEQMPQAETREILPSPSGGGQSSFTAAPLPVLPPAVSPQLSSSGASASAIDDNPVAAGDDDLIEKEWVDKAKKIIATTKNDPYLQEKEVSKLQADYLKKRYGKEIKIPVD